MITITILLSLITILLLYIIFNLNNKVKIYASLLEKSEEDRVNIANGIVKWMSIALDKLHNIDRLQIFEGDDDVGWFFQTLKFQITELNNEIATIIEEEGVEIIDEKNKEEAQ